MIESLPTYINLKFKFWKILIRKIYDFLKKHFQVDIAKYVESYINAIKEGHPIEIPNGEDDVENQEPEVVCEEEDPVLDEEDDQDEDDDAEEAVVERIVQRYTLRSCGIE